MRVHHAAFVALALCTGTVHAQDIAQKDVGTYEWLNATGQPSGVFFKLSQEPDGSWSAEGKLPGKGWQSVSCGEECFYRKSTTAEVVSYFPKDWIAVADVACIQNHAQAFCKAVGKTNPTKQQYFLLTLVTGQASPVLLKRVTD
jgi:hypothetical protein